MKFIVNGALRFSNLDLKPLVPDRKRVFLMMSEEEESKLLPVNPPILRYKLDEYRLPPMLTRSLREMDREEIIEIATTRVEKLVSYFAEEQLVNPVWMKKGDRVRIFLHLVNTDRVILEMKMGIS